MPANRLVKIVTVVVLIAASGWASGQEFEIDWHTIDGGGDMFSTGGDFELSGTIGQPDARTRPMTGGEFSLVGGFWAVAREACIIVPGDFDEDCDVDLADFVTFQQCFAGPGEAPAPACPSGVNADFDGDTDVDVVDFHAFAQYFTGPN